MTNPDPQPWEQQPKETDKAYEYFCTYRDMGRIRTLTKTGQHHTKTTGWMAELSSEKNWKERVQAWDIEQDQQWAKEVQDERRKMAKEHAHVANSMMEKVFEKLAELDLDEMRPSDVSKWVEVATKVKRVAYGEPENTVSLTGPHGGPIQMEDVTQLTVEERRERFKAIIEEAQNRTRGIEGDQAA